MSSYIPPSSTNVPSTPVRDRFLISNKPSPRTPSSTTSTPYTTSLSSSRSLTSSGFTTPSSVKYPPISPLHTKSTKSNADLTENWRERAQLNGIKVSAHASDEAMRKAFLRSPDFSSNSRRTLKPSPFTNPVSSSHRSGSTFNTPSPKANIYQPLGSFTAPPDPRHRAVHDSPFYGLGKGDDVGGSPSSAFTSLRAFRDLSSLEKPSCSPTLRDLSSSCSVCDQEPSGSSRMIVLSPCSHIFCATCFTGTLNIVGEKNMSCMECHSPVDSFHFALGAANAPASDVVSQSATLLGQPFGISALSPVASKPAISASTQSSRRDGIAVLRIDNVPWDVTPIVIEKFIKHPIIQAHVLLDVHGKTLSHAFVQLSPEDARAALRSSQNAILGRGRRARAVTVTLSSQAELMAALYPHWRGSFDGGVPSLDGLDNDQVNEALQHGLISNAELNSLLNLISTPNSHFLKVPSLPFHSLISILSTFPSDVDSRIFWSSQLRDSLFRERLTLDGLHELTHIAPTGVTRDAFQVLASRTEGYEDLELWEKLVVASINCRAFTNSQVADLEHLVKATITSPASNPNTHIGLSASPFDFDSSTTFDELADNFGLHPNVLAALLQSSHTFP